MSEQIPLAKPELGAREEELVREVLRSGRLSLGPMAERFERELAAWLGVEDAVAVSSGTAALHLGVRALGWGAGDEVLTSPFSFVASANCLLYEGARPVFCDVDPQTLNLDPAAAADAVGERTAGVLPVHIFGYPAAMPELEALAGRHDLGLLEDACEALGAVDAEGRRVGARGNVATFAFYANKQLTTGEGGMVVPGDPELAARVRVASLYERSLATIDRLHTPSAGRGSERRSWFVYAVQLPEDADRDATIARLAERGVASKAYLPCIHLFPHLRELGYREGQFPVAEAASARSLALPFFPTMSESQVSRVCEALADCLS